MQVEGLDIRLIHFTTFITAITLKVQLPLNLTQHHQMARQILVMFEPVFSPSQPVQTSIATMIWRQFAPACRRFTNTAKDG